MSKLSDSAFPVVPIYETDPDSGEQIIASCSACLGLKRIAQSGRPNAAAKEWCHECGGTGKARILPGLTKREYFAAMALQGFCANSIPGSHHAEHARDAVFEADALMLELAKAPRSDVK